MYFPTAVALAALPFLVGAVPVKNSLISIPLSKRSTSHDADGVVDVADLQAGISYTGAKYRQGFEAFEKNTGTPHPLASKHSNKRGIHIDVPLTDFHGSMWSGPILIGTPATSFEVLFDTGSADLFISGPNCVSCNGHHIYNPTLSHTSQDRDKLGALSYGTGDATVTGNQYTDKVYVGGFEADNQALLVSSDMSPQFAAGIFNADGLMGLAFDKLSALNAINFFSTIIDQERIDEPVFGFRLTEKGSALVLGGRDSSLYTGSLTYVAVDNPAFWQTAFDGITVNGNDVTVGNKQAIIDTGTTLVLGDLDSITNFYKNIPGSEASESGAYWTIPCSTEVNVSITFAGVAFAISPNIFNLGPTSSGSSTCVGGFGVGPADGFWIIGDVFLRNVYAEFDVGGQRVGFALPA